MNKQSERIELALEKNNRNVITVDIRASRSYVENALRSNSYERLPSMVIEDIVKFEFSKIQHIK